MMTMVKSCLALMLTLTLGGAAPASGGGCACCKPAAPVSSGVTVAGVAGKSAQVTLAVSGMSCAACAAKVQKALLGVAGVRQAQVDVATGKVVVTVDETKADQQAMIKALEQAGYRAQIAK